MFADMLRTDHVFQFIVLLKAYCIEAPGRSSVGGNRKKKTLRVRHEDLVCVFTIMLDFVLPEISTLGRIMRVS